MTGNKSVLRREHFAAMKDGAIVCNSGHFNVEIDIPALERMSARPAHVRPFVEEYRSRAASASTCWARAGSSTWPPPRATRRW